MARSASSYQREIRKLKKLLWAVEWVQPTYNGSPSCSYCGNQQHIGHQEGCELSAIVNAASTSANKR